MFYISESDSDEEVYNKGFERPRTSHQEPDLSSISNPFSSASQMDMTQQQKLQRMKLAAQRQSVSHLSMVSGSTMASTSNRRNSNSFVANTRVQMYGDRHMNDMGIIDETRYVDEYTLHDDDHRRGPNSSFHSQNSSMYHDRHDRHDRHEREPRFAQPQEPLFTSPQANRSNPQAYQPTHPVNQPVNPNSSFNSSSRYTDAVNASTHPDTEEANPRPQSRGVSATIETIPQEKLPVQLDISDRPHFLTHPIPKEYGMVKCYVYRERGKLKLFSKYHMYLENGDHLLISARKRKKNRSSNYLLSLDKNDLHRDSPGYFGKLRSNFVGTEFSIYSKGSRVDRQEYGAILYETNIFGTKGPRKLTIITPSLDEDGEYKLPSATKGIPLAQQFKSNDRKDIHVFTNKQPAWNEKLKAYVLNFNGRVTMASVKNFQLVEDTNPDLVILQFGKVANNKFSLDFRYPLCPMQAFSIALSAYDFKLMCE